MAEVLALGGRASLPGFPRALPSVLSSVRGIFESLVSLGDNPARPAVEAPQDFFAVLEQRARRWGVSAIGYARLPRELVFKGKGVLHPNAVVLAMAMDRRRLAKAPSLDTAVMVHQTYARLGRAANAVARFLRRHGYSAQACHPLGGQVLYPPLGWLAGLGHRGPAGLLVTPDHGPGVRLAAVFTSIENLPFGRGDDPERVERVGEFCSKCGLCIDECPVGAVKRKPTPRPGSVGLVTCIERDKCLPYFAENHGCSVCIRVCPLGR